MLPSLTNPYLGNVYIADTDNSRIRKVTISTGIITTIAGTGTAGYTTGSDNGPATSATLNDPTGVAFDSAGIYYVTFLVALVRLTFTILYLGNVYIADEYNQRIRKVTVSTGIITTVAGTGTYDYSGDNGQATSAALNYPTDVALDSSGTHLLCNLSCCLSKTYFYYSLPR